MGILFCQTIWAIWTPQISGTKASLNAINFMSDKIGLVVGDSGTTIRTQNGGESWQSIKTTAKDTNLIGITFMNSTQGLILGDEGFLTQSIDAGLSWTRIRSPSKAAFSILVGNGDGTSVLGGWDGSIWTSKDNGNHWLLANQINIDTVRTIFAIHFPTPQIGFASTANGILKTVDGGLNWNLILPINSPKIPNAGNFSSIFFTSPMDGFIGRPYYSAIAKTINGGQEFSIVTTRAATFSLYFTSQDTGYAACNGGMLYRTFDAGKTWSIDIDLKNELITFKKIIFINKGNGFVVGGGGTILHMQNSSTIKKQKNNRSKNRMIPNDKSSQNSLYFDSIGSVKSMNEDKSLILFSKKF